MKFLLIIILLLSVTWLDRSTPAIYSEPILLAAVFPAYPPIAKAANATGDTSIETVINSQGDVINAKSISSHKLLDEAAQFAARQWKFNKISDKTMNRTVVLTFRFTLMPRCSDKRTHTPVFTAPYTVEIRQEKSRITCTHCTQKTEDELNCKNP